MTLLVRFILVSLIIYLLIRSFSRYFEEQEPSSNLKDPEYRNNKKSTGISKEVGEYIDYEEVDDQT